MKGPSDKVTFQEKSFEGQSDIECAQSASSEISATTPVKLAIIKVVSEVGTSKIRLQPPQLYSCFLCKFSTLFQLKFKDHIQVHFGEELVCIHCGFITHAVDSFTKHFRRHITIGRNDATFTCEQKNPCSRIDCKFMSNRIEQFISHRKLYHLLDALKCQSCQSVFSNVKEFTTHLQSNLLTIVACPSCQAKATDKGSILRHIFKHHPKKGMFISITKKLICKDRLLNNFDIERILKLQKEWHNDDDNKNNDDVQLITYYPETSTSHLGNDLWCSNSSLLKNVQLEAACTDKKVHIPQEKSTTSNTDNPQSILVKLQSSDDDTSSSDAASSVSPLIFQSSDAATLFVSPLKLQSGYADTSEGLSADIQKVLDPVETINKTAVVSSSPARKRKFLEQSSKGSETWTFETKKSKTDKVKESLRNPEPIDHCDQNNSEEHVCFSESSSDDNEVIHVEGTEDISKLEIRKTDTNLVVLNKQNNSEEFVCSSPDVLKGDPASLLTLNSSPDAFNANPASSLAALEDADQDSSTNIVSEPTSNVDLTSRPHSDQFQSSTNDCLKLVAAINKDPASFLLVSSSSSDILNEDSASLLASSSSSDILNEDPASLLASSSSSDILNEDSASLLALSSSSDILNEDSASLLASSSSSDILNEDSAFLPALRSLSDILNKDSAFLLASSSLPDVLNEDPVSLLASRSSEDVLDDASLQSSTNDCHKLIATNNKLPGKYKSTKNNTPTRYVKIKLQLDKPKPKKVNKTKKSSIFQESRKIIKSKPEKLSGNDPYQCPKCSFKTVFDEELMVNHIKEEHQLGVVYECNTCSAKFFPLGRLQRHQNFLHRDNENNYRILYV